MKKTIIIFFNLILFLFIFYILEFISYNLIFGNFNNYSNFILSSVSYKDLSVLIPKYNNNYDYAIEPEERNYENISYNINKRPILLLGCSYTYGQGLTEDKIFGTQLQKYTGIKTNTVAHMGASPDLILGFVRYMYNNGSFDDNNYEYAIYTLMYHHIYRLEATSVDKYLIEKHYLNKNNSIKNRIVAFLDNFYTVRYINLRLFIKNEDNLYEYQREIIKKIYGLIKQKIPDIKFIFLIYDDLTNNGHEGTEKESLNPDLWKELEKNGIQVITTKELVGDVLYKPEYKLKYDTFQDPHHPNEKAWALIVPALAKKLNL